MCTFVARMRIHDRAGIGSNQIVIAIMIMVDTASTALSLSFSKLCSTERSRQVILFGADTTQGGRFSTHLVSDGHA